MDTAQLLKRAAIVFAAALVGYFAVFQWIEHRRVVKGPWRVEFTADGTQAQLLINQTRLGVRNVAIQFANFLPATNVSEIVEFASVRRTPYDLPLGRCLFQDLVFLPGTVVIEAAGHQIQLLPRTLTIDGREQPWRNEEIIRLEARPPGSTNDVVPARESR